MKRESTCQLPPALTVHHPWAWALVTGIKRIENRTWHTDHQGPLLIHAAKSLATLKDFGPLDDPSKPPQFEDGMPLPPLEQLKATLGSIIGVVHLERTEDFNARKHKRLSFACGPVLWYVSEVRAFTRPIPCTGQLGLWRVPETLVAIVGAQLKEVQALPRETPERHLRGLLSTTGAREGPGRLPGPQQATSLLTATPRCSPNRRTGRWAVRDGRIAFSKTP
jgi:hypothetical protein